MFTDGSDRIRAWLLAAVVVGSVLAAGPVAASGAELTAEKQSVTVETGWTDALNETAQIVEANVTNLTGVDNATVFIEYRQNGTANWQRSASQSVTTAKSVTVVLADLESATAYEYRAVAVAGSGAGDTGSTRTFRTLADGPTIHGETVTDVDTTAVRIVGNLSSLGDSDSVAVKAEYRAVGADQWQATEPTSYAQAGEVRERVSRLDPNTTYEYVLQATGEFGNTDQVTGTFTTDSQFGVRTAAAAGIDASTIGVEGAITDLGGAKSATVQIQISEAGEAAWQNVTIAKRTTVGTVEGTVTQLPPGTQFDVRIRGVAADGDTDVGQTLTATTATEPVVETIGATAVDTTSATIAATLVDDGGAGSVTVSLQYRTAGTDTWTTTQATEVTAGDTVEQHVSGLAADTTYEVRAIVADGQTTSAIETFETESRVAIATAEATDVGETSARLRAEVLDLGGASTGTVAFAYRQVGAPSWTVRNVSVNATGPVSTTVTGLQDGTEYEYRAGLLAADGDGATGETVTFETTQAARPPTVDVEASESSPPNPHAALSIGWRAADVDGDLSSVEIVVSDAWDRVVASDSRQVSGSGASGSLDERVKHGAGERYTVTVTVTDAAGNAVERTAIIQA